MKIGKLEIYKYKTNSSSFGFHKRNDVFYCKNRLFRYEIIILSQVINIQWWIK